MNITKNNKGISVVETLVIIAIVGVIVAMVTPSLVSFRRNQALQNSTNAIVSVLQEARAKTLASYNNTFYSVYFGANSVTLFSGQTYVPSEVTNKVISYESPVILQNATISGGGSQITFDRLKGTTSQSGTIVIGIPSGNTKAITVSSSGVIGRN